MKTEPRLLSHLEEDGVLILPDNVVITPVLGRLRVQGASLNESVNPAQNSSRWVFNILGNSGADLEIKLLEFRSGRHLIHELVSLSLTPLSETFYDAKPYFVLEPGVIVLKTLKAFNCHYRVSVDAIHSTTR